MMRRLMLPYLAFAGAVTVMMALLNARGVCADHVLAAAVNLALIAELMAALLVRRQEAGVAGPRRRRHRRPRRAAAIADPGVARRRHRKPAAHRVRSADAPLSGPGDPRHDRRRLAAIAGAGRRRGGVVIALGGVVAGFRQSPDRPAARHRRRRHGYRAGARIDARRARRKSQRHRACGVARARTGRRPRAAGDAGIARARRADRAAAARFSTAHSPRPIPRRPRRR